MNVCKKWGWGLREGLESGVRERRDEEEGLGTAWRSQCSLFPRQELHLALCSGCQHQPSPKAYIRNNSSNFNRQLLTVISDHSPLVEGEKQGFSLCNLIHPCWVALQKAFFCSWNSFSAGRERLQEPPLYSSSEGCWVEMKDKSCTFFEFLFIKLFMK